MYNFLKNVTISEKQLLEELEVLLKDEYEAKIENSGKSLTISFPNNQNFVLTVQKN